MGSMTIGALIGAGIDSLSGDDGVGDGAIIGGATAGVLKLVAPIAVTFVAGWLTLRAVDQLRQVLASSGGRA